MNIQTITSPGGIEAWLLEDYAVPMFALRFAFEGGSMQDPPGKEGLANFVTLMLHQGAGDMTGAQFQQRVEDLAVRLGFRLGADAITFSLEALSETWSEAAGLLHTVIARPRFDDDAVERVRARLLGFAGGEARRPRIVASEGWNAAAFADHSHAHRRAGNEASINAITAEDLRTFRRNAFARDNLKVVAVGDISVDELAKFLDRAFGDLPEHAELEDVPRIAPVTGGRVRVAEIDVPQSVVAFGGGSIPYHSPDFIPALLLTQIVGGRNPDTRLSTELRSKRGLAHVARARLQRWPGGAIFRGSITSRNEAVGEVLDLLREELCRVARGDISQADLDSAKAYLSVTDPVGFSTPASISAQLLNYALCGLEPTFLQGRDAMIAAVTLDDVKRVAGRVLDPENLIISIAGTPALQPRAGHYRVFFAGCGPCAVPTGCAMARGNPTRSPRSSSA